MAIAPICYRTGTIRYPRPSISAGLDYPGIGPVMLAQRSRPGELCFRHGSGSRGRFPSADPARRRHSGLGNGSRLGLCQPLGALPKDHVSIVCLSGRGDKDMNTVPMGAMARGGAVMADRIDGRFAELRAEGRNA